MRLKLEGLEIVQGKTKLEWQIRNAASKFIHGFEKRQWCQHCKYDDDGLTDAAPGSPLCRSCEQDPSLFGWFKLYKYPAAVERILRPDIREAYESGFYREAAEKLDSDLGINEVVPFPARAGKALKKAAKTAGRRIDQAARAIGVRRI